MIVVPEEHELLHAIGVAPVRLDEGDDLYLLEHERATRILSVTYDLIGRSARIRVSEGPDHIIADLYLEGLVSIRLDDQGASAAIQIGCSDLGFKSEATIGLLPVISVEYRSFIT